jgi:hypothetical protein
MFQLFKQSTKEVKMTKRIDGKEIKQKSKTGSSKASLFPYDITPKHYSNLPIEPWDFIQQNKLDFFEGNVIKYICRWRAKGGADDLRKAITYIEKLIDSEKWAPKALKEE